MRKKRRPRRRVQVNYSEVIITKSMVSLLILALALLIRIINVDYTNSLRQTISVGIEHTMTLDEMPLISTFFNNDEEDTYIPVFSNNVDSDDDFKIDPSILDSLDSIEKKP